MTKAAALAILCAALTAPASGQSLDSLLQEVRENRRQVNAGVQARLREFREQRDNQAALLRDVRQQLAAAELRGAQLSAQFEANQLELDEMEQNLRSRTGDMSEVFGVVRQYAGDVAGAFRSSLVSAQLGKRGELLSLLAESGNVPPPEQLREFHELMLEEMVQSGKVARYGADIVNAAGEPTAAEVVRVGTFNLVSGDRFLRYDLDTGITQELPRQPQRRFRNDAASLTGAADGLVRMAIDPTAGALLSLLIQTPGTAERVKQGGSVGYVILMLGAIGLLIAAVRVFYLLRVSAGIHSQLKSDEPRDDNALGRVLSVYRDNRSADTETLELKLDEAIMKETPGLEQWQVALKVIAAVAPLLGLLGTVVGMIQTFQQITLFGTGDPKLMAGGISKALVTTMLGLIVAIPMVLLHSLVASRSRYLIEILEEQSAGIVATQAGTRP